MINIFTTKTGNQKKQEQKQMYMFFLKSYLELTKNKEVWLRIDDITASGKNMSSATNNDAERKLK